MREQKSTDADSRIRQCPGHRTGRRGPAPGEGPPDRPGSGCVAYDRRPGRRPRWRLRSLLFDREEWTRSAIRRWWAAHEVHLLAADQLDRPIPDICRAYPAPSPALPTIVLCHRNTPLIPAQKQIDDLDRGKKRAGDAH